jgi:muramoyltetrapeptide carboxypeptidase
MIIPNKLQIWDTIWIISPSAWLCSIFPHRVNAWVKMLEKIWFKVKFAKNSKENLGYVSTTIQERVDDIHEMFLDKDVNAIICSIWWNHSNQLLKYIDYEIIKNNPKIFIWYSDITVLHYAFLSQADLQTFYWPCLIPEFWEFPEMLDYSRKYFLEAVFKIWNIKIEKINYYTDELLNWITKEDLTRKRDLKEIDWFKWLRWWIVEWEIIWWCIPSINHLIWTDYWIDVKDKIFFIDIPEWHEIWKWLSIADLDAYLTDLDNLEVFSKIKWLLVSVPYWYSQKERQELENLIIRFVWNKNYVVWLNFPIWHTDPMITIPLLSKVSINSNKDKFII